MGICDTASVGFATGFGREDDATEAGGREVRVEGTEVFSLGKRNGLFPGFFIILMRGGL